MGRIPGTTLEVFPLCLGGNVFGWTADERQSFEVLDAYLAAGGNFIDTADVYSAWVPGHTGGESETIVGRWMAKAGARNQMIVATKVGMSPGLKGLSPRTIRTAAEASLRRLGIDRIDIYYAHADDPETPLADSLRAFDALVDSVERNIPMPPSQCIARSGHISATPAASQLGHCANLFVP